MTIPKQAIEKAIEGGWIPRGFAKLAKNPKEVQEVFNSFYPTQESIAQHYHEFEYALTPAFWQALDKSCGWEDGNFEGIGQFVPEWRMNAKTFYDLILTGQNTDTFWQEILSTHP